MDAVKNHSINQIKVSSEDEAPLLSYQHKVHEYLRNRLYDIEVVEEQQYKVKLVGWWD